MNHQKYFEAIYKDFINSEEYKEFAPNIGIIGIASKYKIAVAGSTGIHLASKKANKVPNDLDFVTDSNELAMAFMFEVLNVFSKYKWYGKIQINNKTDFCFEGTSQHYKITNSFGINCCVMVLNTKLNYWFNEVGICTQSIDDIISFSKMASEIDKKDRRIVEINLENYIDKDVKALVECIKGETVLYEMIQTYNLYTLEMEYDHINIIIPDWIITINKSFFIGLFGIAIKRLGKDLFKEKYIFSTTGHIRDKINEFIECAY